MSGAQVAIAISEAKAADIVILGISPLNFGTSLKGGPFKRQCLRRLAPSDYDESLYFKSCFPIKIEPENWFNLIKQPFQKGFQFQGFTHNIAKSFSIRKEPPPAKIPMTPERVIKDLLETQEALDQSVKTNKAIPNLENGKNATFQWNDREVIPSLTSKGEGYKFLKTIKI